MPFYAIIGIIWALMVIGIGQWGRQRNLDVTLLKAIQAILTLVALAIVAPVPDDFLAELVEYVIDGAKSGNKYDCREAMVSILRRLRTRTR